MTLDNPKMVKNYVEKALEKHDISAGNPKITKENTVSIQLHEGGDKFIQQIGIDGFSFDYQGGFEIPPVIEIYNCDSNGNQLIPVDLPKWAKDENEKTIKITVECE